MGSFYPPGDPYWSNVVLHLDGTSTTDDLSDDNRTVVAYGDVYSDGTRIIFNRTGDYDYLDVDSGGTSIYDDWCFECYVKITEYPPYVGGNDDLYMIWKPWGTGGFALEIKYPGYWSLYVPNSTYSQCTDLVPLGKDVHLAASKESTTFRLFQEGKKYVEVTANQIIGQDWIIGTDISIGNARGLKGALRDIRLTLGVPRYTTDFTPPGSRPANAMMFSCNT